MSLVYRRPFPGEELSLAEIRARAMRESLEAAGRFDEQRVRQRLLGTYSAEETTVVENDGAVIGFYVMTLKGREDEVFLSHLYLDTPYQGVGYGAEIINHIKTTYATRSITLQALTGSRSQAFYENHGFIKVGESEFDTLYRIDPVSAERPSPDDETAELGIAVKDGETVTIDAMREDEAPAVFSLVTRVFDEFVRKDFTDEGVEEFMKSARDLVYHRREDHRIFVAHQGKRVIGMIEIREHCHVCLFFVDKAFHHQGIGRRLLDRAVAECRLHRPHCGFLEVNSSIYAVGIYASFGFVATHPEQQINGIRFIPMVMSLSAYWDELFERREHLLPPEEFIVDHIDYLVGSSVLDLGAGDGRNARVLAGKGYQVTALDYSEVGLRKIHAADPEIAIVHMDANDSQGVRKLGRNYDNIILNHFVPDTPTLELLPDLLHDQGVMIIVAFHPVMEQRRRNTRNLVIDDSQLAILRNSMTLITHEQREDERGVFVQCILKRKAQCYPSP